jgi:hypothetical protein
MRSRLAAAIVSVLLLVSSAVAADIDGIWAGQHPGRNGQVDDVAFQFKVHSGKLTGTLFGDEFDLPISDATVAGDQVRFTVVSTNYFSGRKVVDMVTGTIKGTEMELVRERVQTPEEKAANRPPFKQTIKLKRLT